MSIGPPAPVHTLPSGENVACINDALHPTDRSRDQLEFERQLQQAASEHPACAEQVAAFLPKQPTSRGRSDDPSSADRRRTCAHASRAWEAPTRPGKPPCSSRSMSTGCTSSFGGTTSPRPCPDISRNDSLTMTGSPSTRDR